MSPEAIARKLQVEFKRGTDDLDCFHAVPRETKDGLQFAFFPHLRQPLVDSEKTTVLLTSRNHSDLREVLYEILRDCHIDDNALRWINPTAIRQKDD